MASRKHEYEVRINTLPKKHSTYQYNYGHTKGIEISIGKDAAVIRAAMTAKYEARGLVCPENKTFSDALKKALLLHLILFSKNMEMKKMIVCADDTEEEIPVGDGEKNPLIYSLAARTLKKPFPAAWNNKAFIEKILSLTKSGYDSRVASLFALICAKGKLQETERFIYLWMAMNGVYSYFRVLMNTEENVKRNGGREIAKWEWKQIRALKLLYNLGLDMVESKRDKKIISQDVVSVLRKWDGEPITEESLENGRHQALANEIRDKLWAREPDSREKRHALEMSAYGYLLLELTYYYRCNVVHAEKPVTLFYYENEHELTSLRIMNQIMEDFLDAHLYQWFDQAYIDNTLQPEADAIWRMI
ncbi:MAG: hypothetical protein IJ496_01405 [Ruminococcus sp.]|nr:hypothetical protein [Ruminococcus sp.]